MSSEMRKNMRPILLTVVAAGLLGALALSCIGPTNEPAGSDGSLKSQSLPCLPEELNVTGRIWKVSDPTTPLVGSVYQPWTIVVDQDPNGYLYYAERAPGYCKGSVKRIKKDGTLPPETLLPNLDLTDLDRPSWIILDNPASPTYLYVTEFVAPLQNFVDPKGDPNITYTTDGGRLIRVPVVGGMAEVLAEGLTLPFGIAVDADYAYFTESIETIPPTPPVGTVKKVDLKDPTHPVTTLASDLNAPIGVQVDATYVYVVVKRVGQVIRMNKDGTNRVVLAGGFGSPYPAVLDGGDLYFADFNSGTTTPGKVYKLLSVSSITTTTTASDCDAGLSTDCVLLATTLNWPMLAAVDANNDPLLGPSNVYFSEVWSSAIKSAPKIGGGPTVELVIPDDTATGPQFMAVATDGTNVYYSDLSGDIEEGPPSNQEGEISCCF